MSKYSYILRGNIKNHCISKVIDKYYFNMSKLIKISHIFKYCDII